ncbi:unnamed protein product [Orchesella dallaii]|uniref:Serine--tRNA ligase, mitochondrial n=1 Tax=Orchesella dallaii TaxID=48710 RepID=A0ABP1R017_9HEXA
MKVRLFLFYFSPKHRQENKIHNLSSYSSGLRQYSAQNLFRLTETSASQLQPYLDVNNIIKIQDVLQDSINKRQLTRKQVKEVKILFHKAQAYQRRKETAIQLKEENTTKYQALSRAENGKEVNKEKLLELKEQGRLLRDEVRAAEAKFNEVNDSLVDFVLSIPNILDKETPASEAQLLKEVVPKIEFEYDPEYTAVETQCGPGLLAEFPIGKAAWLDIDLRGRAQAHLLNGGFVETGNAEYVKRLILQGAGMDESQFLRIREPNVKKGWEHATYLAGGASFPSFLALFAQSIIEDPKILPIRYFVIGRSYESQKTKPGFYQSHVVQAFVACRNEEEMEKEFHNLQNLMESFYSEKVGFTFQTQIVPAPRLQMYERKKLAFVMNKTDKSASKMIGTLSTVGDYVSKRLLCCYFDEKKKTQFLHLISAKFFDITHFLRSPSPKLITHSDILAKGKPSPEMLTFENDESQNQRQP